MDLHPSYSSGIIASLGGTLFHAGANILDSYFTGKLVHRLSHLVFYTALARLLFLPLSMLADMPHGLTRTSFWMIFLVAGINVFYQFPYWWSLQTSDTSVVSSLFSLGQLFTPLLAFVALKETLSFGQYTGFFLIVLSSMLLTFDFHRFRFQRTFFYMLSVSLMLIIQAILFKRLYAGGMSWGTSVFWSTIMEVGIASLVLFFHGRHRGLHLLPVSTRQMGALLLLNQFLSWTGEVLGLYALTLIPVSVFEGISSTQPLFVLVISIACVRYYPQLLKEGAGTKRVLGKVVLFMLMTVGTLMIIRRG